jgi:cell wall-associated NlpC family hydrolase
MNRDELVAAAIAMVGTPFHAQGRMPGVGLDCVGVVVCAARQCGHMPNDRSAYPMQPDGTLRPAIEAALVRVDGAPEPGDVLLMAFAGLEPHHVAIYIGDDQIVHAYVHARKVAKQQYTQYWKSKVVAVYRFPEAA